MFSYTNQTQKTRHCKYSRRRSGNALCTQTEQKNTDAVIGIYICFSPPLFLQPPLLFSRREHIFKSHKSTNARTAICETTSHKTHKQTHKTTNHMRTYKIHKKTCNYHCNFCAIIYYSLELCNVNRFIRIYLYIQLVILYYVNIK